MDALFRPLAAATGASLDQLKLISCLLIAYPLGSVFVRIPSSQPALKHIFNIAIALFFFLPILNAPSAFFQLLANVLATYYITGNVKGPRMPWVTFAFVFGHLTLNHVIRAIYNRSYETFDITGPQMVLTMKLTTFAWNVYDGQRPQGDLDKWQLEKRITTRPSILEFLGYAFYFPGVLVGPSLEFVDYMILINETAFKNDKSSSEAGRVVPKGRKRVAYRKMALGLAYLGGFVVLGPKFNFSVALDPWFKSQGFIYRVLYFQVCGLFERFKYYAVWTLTEGSSVLTGLGFTGYGPNGETLWEGAANVNVPNIELAPNFKVLLDSWNIKTNVWLRECVYKRVTPKGKKPGFRSSMITFGTSAFWHGIAGGYYLSFLTGGFITAAARLSRATIRPLLLPPAEGVPPSPLKRLYDILGTTASVLILNYAASPFMVLSVQNSFTVWHRLGYYGHVMLVVAMAFFYGGGAAWLRGLQKKQAQRLKIDKPPVATSFGSSVSLPETPNSGLQHTVPPLDLAALEMEKKLLNEGKKP